MEVRKFNFETTCFFIFVLIIGLSLILAVASKSTYSASDVTNACSKEAVLQLAKIVYKEVGADCALDSSENFFMRITSASIVLNNANKLNGATWYNKIYGLSNNTYQGYSTYKDKSFDSVVVANQNEILYISQLVLSGKYNLPKNMIFAASQEIVKLYGTIWDSVDTYNGFVDTFFGYDNSLSNIDIFGRTIENTSNTYYRNLAESLKLDDYSSYTVDNICQVNLGSSSGSESQPEPQKYNVNFYINDGSDTLYKTLEVAANNSVVLPTDPTRDNYKFEGWVYSSGEVFNSNLVITSNLDLYASWSEVINNNDNMNEDITTPPIDDSENNQPSVPDNSQNVDSTPQTGDKHLFIIILGIIALDVSIYFYKKRTINVN